MRHSCITAFIGGIRTQKDAGMVSRPRQTPPHWEEPRAKHRIQGLPRSGSHIPLGWKRWCKKETFARTKRQTRAKWTTRWWGRVHKLPELRVLLPLRRLLPPIHHTLPLASDARQHGEKHEKKQPPNRCRVCCSASRSEVRNRVPRRSICRSRAT